MTEQIKKILIIKPSALGDIIQAMPAACCLADNFPEAKIHWFVRPEFAALVENHKCIHKIVIFDRKKLGKWWYKPSAFAELVRLIKQLRTEKYDIVLDFQGRFRSAIFAWFSGCKQRIGMAETQEITGLFYTRKIAQSENSIHLVDYFLDMVCSIGAKKTEVHFGLKPDMQAVSEIRNILLNNNADADNYAVFVPGATVEAKKWPIENFAALAEKVHKKYQCSIVVAGVESENAAAKVLQTIANVPVINLAGNKTPIINLAGKTNIRQLIALLAYAKAVVSNDTGPAHLASALDVPMVLIFGFTNPSRVAPYDRPQTIAAIDTDKRGQEVESLNPDHNIRNVTVENVFETISRQLD
jgi:heptosyltransferase-1